MRFQFVRDLYQPMRTDFLRLRWQIDSVCSDSRGIEPKKKVYFFIFYREVFSKKRSGRLNSLAAYHS